MDTWRLLEVLTGLIELLQLAMRFTRRTVDVNGQHRRLVKSDTIRVVGTKEQNHDEKLYGYRVERGRIGIGSGRNS